MQILDFLTILPDEEKDFFVNLLEATVPVGIAVRETMRILAESEPKLAKRLERPVQDWLKTSEPIIIRNNSNSGRRIINPGIVSFEAK